jgi:hypothetical protein
MQADDYPHVLGGRRRDRLPAEGRLGAPERRRDIGPNEVVGAAADIAGSEAYRLCTR